MIIEVKHLFPEILYSTCYDLVSYVLHVLYYLISIRSTTATGIVISR